MQKVFLWDMAVQSFAAMQCPRNRLSRLRLSDQILGVARTKTADNSAVRNPSCFMDRSIRFAKRTPEAKEFPVVPWPSTWI